MAKRPPPRTSYRTFPQPPENPVLGAELAYLQHSKRQGSARIMFWLLLLALGASLGLGLAIYLMGRSGSLGAGDLPLRFQTFRDYQNFANVLLVITALTSGPVLLLETLLLSSDSIARERRNGTWTLLVLTPLTAWQIITGKWRASQSCVYRYYSGIILLRAMAFVWLGLSSGLTRSPDGQDVPGLLLAVISVIGFMALNLALASATSLLASFQSWPISAFGIAIGLQFVLALVIAAANLLLFRPLLDQTGQGLEVSIMMALMPFDSGAIVASQLLDDVDAGLLLTFVTSVLLNTALLAGLAFGLLRLSRRLAVRLGAAA